MNRSLSPSLMFVELLADRNRLPSALLLGFAGSDPEVFLPLVEHSDFHGLAKQFPCAVVSPDASFPPASLADALESAGCKLVVVPSVHRTNDSGMGNLPAGVQWVAGDWYMAPPSRPIASQATSRTIALQLVQLVMADADTHEIEAVLRHDPALSYHLLRVVNSLGMGMGKKITSFSQAILILGRAQLRRWLNLMLFSSREGDERSAMLLARVAARARMMELVAKAAGQDKSAQDMAFMAGMFSLLGILFGLPLGEVLKPLKISDTLSAALLERSGELGQLLALAEAEERADGAALAAELAALQVTPEEFNLLNVQAHTWMIEVVRGNRGGGNA
ncbi:MAG TPA: HDOD domain-containing protein [Paucimonas sp.]|nr:HDOD domain-containing protein [Paucimonas sp.]